MKASSSASLRGLYCGQWSGAGQFVDLQWEGSKGWDNDRLTALEELGGG